MGVVGPGRTRPLVAVWSRAGCRFGSVRGLCPADDLDVIDDGSKDSLP